MNIYFFRLSSLFLFLCGVRFIFKSTIIMYYTWTKDLTSSVTPHLIDGEILIYLILFYFIIIWNFFY